jgi:subtilase family serine protease
VKNQGSNIAGNSTTSFYLSTNFSLDSGDKLLGGRSVPALQPGQTNSGSTTLTIPADTQLGQYFIPGRADDGNKRSGVGRNEQRVVRDDASRPGSDGVALTAPANAVAGATIQANDTVKNTGGGSAGASTTRFYLSSNFTFDASDQEIGNRPAIALGPNATSAGQASVTIPSGTAAGLYYIIAVSDADNAVPETSETNNTRSLAIRIN